MLDPIVVCDDLPMKAETGTMHRARKRSREAIVSRGFSLFKSQVPQRLLSHRDGDYKYNATEWPTLSEV